MKWPFRRKKHSVGAIPSFSTLSLNHAPARPATPIRPQEFRAGRTPRANDKFVAIMGVTGSGKSSFIELLTGANVKIGMGLEACTSKIDVYPLELSPDQTVFLIDTPGFNDTFRSDGQILVEITTWLSDSYNNKVHLNGVIYLHDITQGKMYGSSLRTLKTFKELSGGDAMKKVILTTTHWDIVHPGSLAQAEDREKQLTQTDAFWGSMIAKGSRVERHDNTKASAERLIQLVVPQSPVTLAVQSQMVDQHLKLSETTAGKTLTMDLIRKMDDKYRQELEELRQNKKKSDEARRRHERELAEMRKKLEITSREMTERMNRELEAREERYRKQVEEQAQREEEARREQKEEYDRKEQALRREIEQLRAQEWEDEEEEASDDDVDEEDGNGEYNGGYDGEYHNGEYYTGEYEEDDDDDDDDDDEEDDEDTYDYDAGASGSNAVMPYNCSNVVANNNNNNNNWNNGWNNNGYTNGSSGGSYSIHMSSRGIFTTGNSSTIRVGGGGMSITSNIVVNGRRIPYNGGSVNVNDDGVMINGRWV